MSNEAPQHTTESDASPIVDVDRIAAALGGEHRLPIFASDGRQIGWHTFYVTGPQAEVMAAAVAAELRTSTEQRAGQ